MIVTTKFEDINWGRHAHDVITIKENYSPSNDYEDTEVYINFTCRAECSSTKEAVIKSLGSELGTWILNHMGK